jgi:Family of unknown function (DUF6318)
VDRHPVRRNAVGWNAEPPVTTQSAPLKKLATPLLALLLVTSALLAGCGGDPTPDAPPPTTASSPQATTAAPTPTSPASASPTTDPNIPAAARAHTPAGAEAFVRYFYSQLNLAWSKPQAGLISSLSNTTCKTCSSLEGSAQTLVLKHQRYRGEVFTVQAVASTGESKVLVTGEQPRGAVVDIKGSPVKSRTTAQQAKFIVDLRWSSGGWRIQEMKVMK